MRRHIPHIFVVLVSLFFLFCKKKKTENVVEPVPLPVVGVTDELPVCTPLPPAPIPLGWRDSSYNEDSNVNAFVANPLNADEVMCVVNGDLFGFNKLINRNLVSRAQKQIAILGNYLPDVNKNGWITFSDATNNVFIIKTNGDSLKQLTFDKVYVNPRWDFSNLFIYVLRQAQGSFPQQLYKLNRNGDIVEIYDGELPYSAPFNKSNKLIYLKTAGNFCVLTLKNFDSVVVDRPLVTAPLYVSSGNLYFEDLTLDESDENLFWSNSRGIYKCNLKTLEIDTVFKNCENSTFYNVMSSFNPGEMTYTVKYIKPINSTILLSDYLPMQWDLRSNSSRIFRIFPR